MAFWSQRSRRPKFDLSTFGASAQAQLQAAGVKLGGQKNKARYQRAPAERRTHNGVVFDSVWEMHVYIELEKALGKSNIRRQVRFVLQDKIKDGEGKKHRAWYYVADFVVGDIVMDAKGVKTERFKLSEKLFAAKYPKPIVCINYEDRDGLREIIEKCKLHLHQIR